jgi:hypothetical protein
VSIEKQPKKFHYNLWATLPPDKEMMFRALAKKENIAVTKLTQRALLEFIDRTASNEIIELV